MFHSSSGVLACNGPYKVRYTSWSIIVDVSAIILPDREVNDDLGPMGRFRVRHAMIIEILPTMLFFLFFFALSFYHKESLIVRSMFSGTLIAATTSVR